MQKVLLDSSVLEGLAPEGFDGIRMTECLILEPFSWSHPLSVSFLQIEKTVSHADMGTHVPW